MEETFVERTSETSVSKSMTVRNLFLVFAITNLIGFTSFSQGFQGEWKIDHLILDTNRQEYVLSPLSADRRENYGNHIRLNADNSFRTWYTAWCGNSCFVSSSGKCQVVDENYMQFRIDTITYTSDCGDTYKNATFPINSGKLYIYKGNEKTKFIKSTGNLEKDEVAAKYIDSIETNYLESTKFSHLFNWIQPDSEIELSPENSINVYMNATKTRDLTILSSRKMSRNITVVLVEADNYYNYIYCRSSYAREKEIIDEVAIYDKSMVEKISKSASEIEESLSRFRIEEIKNQTEFGEEINKIYRKSGKIRKVVIEKKYENGTTTIDYYFENDAPIFIHSINDLIDIKSKKEYYSETEFFLLGEGQFISKIIESVYQRMGDAEYHRCMKYLNAILENE